MLSQYVKAANTAYKDFGMLKEKSRYLQKSPNLENTLQGLHNTRSRSCYIRLGSLPKKTHKRP